MMIMRGAERRVFLFLLKSEANHELWREGRRGQHTYLLFFFFFKQFLLNHSGNRTHDFLFFPQVACVNSAFERGKE